MDDASRTAADPRGVTEPTGTLAATLRQGESVAATTELAPGETVGRYLLLGRLGAGAMGVVYAAHDPELDRKIALKLVQPRAGGTDEVARARLLREAQALARLSHPNVVAVHDAGTHRDRVWIAMEFVAGQTLDVWVRDRERRWQDVCRVLVDAALGVAAAHAAGLVHRDLKPENVMIDREGRVRVMDFGLAHGRGPGSEAPSAGQALSGAALRLTAAGSVQGTPAYMAPEQWEGHEVGAAADQFGWCVMAWEMLYGERPFDGDNVVSLAAAVLAGRLRPPPRNRHVPRWLRRVLERGLSVTPERRWPSMTALLAATERGRWRSRLSAAALGLVGVAALIGGAEDWRRRDVARRTEACVASGATIDAVWNDDARRRLRDAFAATDVPYAGSTADLVIPWLDRQAASWARTRTHACLNVSVRAVWTDDTLARSLGCLDERRADFEALVVELGRPTPMVVRKAVTAVARLLAADRCTDLDLLRRLPEATPEGNEALREVRAALSRAHSLELTGDTDAALAAVTEARRRAEDLPEWPQARAAALAREGNLLGKLRDYAASETASTEAYFEALRVGAWETAARAATDLINSVGGESRRERRIDRINWSRHAAQAVLNTGDPVGLWEAGRLNNLAIVHFDTGELTEARTMGARATALWERALGPAHPDVAASLDNTALMAVAAGDAEAARAMNERALAIWTRALGPEHPSVAASLLNLAFVHYSSGDLEQARAVNERALHIYERALGPDHLDVGRSLNSLGNVRLALGDTAAARALHERALTLRERALGDRHIDVAESLSNLAEAHQAAGDLAQARALLERALIIQAAALGPEHPDVALSQAWLGQLDLTENRPRDALERLERAVAVMESAPGIQPGEAAACLALAEALVATNGDLARARVLGGKARDAYREAGELDKFAVAERWLAAHEPAPPPRRPAR